MESSFDPTGREMERGGWRFTPPDAEQISHMPPDVVDGKVEPGTPGKGDDAVDPAAARAANEARSQEDDGKLNPDSATQDSPNPGEAVSDDITGAEDI